MNKVLKVILIVLAILLVLGMGGTIAFLYISNNNAIEAKDAEILQLQDKIDQVGDLEGVYILLSDVVPGQQIQDTDFDIIDVPLSMSAGMLTDIEPIIGKYYKIALPAGTAVTETMILEQPLEKSTRYLDVVTNENALGLTPGDYVDIRVSMPLGEDYLAMSHKRVAEINSNILKLEVNEWDIVVYSSLLNDMVLYPGTRIYSIEYVEPGAQQAASTFYPPSKNILAIAAQDPNLEDEIDASIVTLREQLDLALQDALAEDIAKVLQKGKTSITDLLTDANKAIYKRWEEEAKAAAKAEGGGGGISVGTIGG